MWQEYHICMGYTDTNRGNASTTIQIQSAHRPARRGRVRSMVSRAFILFIALTIFMVTAIDPADAARKRSKKAAAPAVDRYASIVVDADSGFVLSEKNPDKRLYPASLTKMMTLYMAFEALDNGTLRKNERIDVSKRASIQEPSKLGLVAGTTIRAEDAILALVTKSANDAAVTLAEHIGGSEDRFARMMTLKAQKLGMNTTRFMNASGLHNPSQYSTARDMSALGRALVRDFPRHYQYFSTREFTYAGRTYNNHNHLMKTYQGMDGIKTGYVYVSGYNLVASAVRGDRRLVGVVFGGKTSKSRNAEMKTLLDKGFVTVRDPRVAALIAKRKAALLAAKAPVTAKGVKTAAAVAKPSGQRPVTLTAPTDAQRLDQMAAAATAPAAGTNTNSLAGTIDPAFNALDLVDEETAEGDSDDVTFDQATAPAVTPLQNRKVSLSDVGNTLASDETGFVSDFRPRPLNTMPINPPVATKQPASSNKVVTLTPPATTTTASKGTGTWAVQVGAFSSHTAGMSALQSAHKKLPTTLKGNSQYVIAPLMTNRGMIYRARLARLEKDQATQACRILKGSCLILAMQ